MGLFSKIGRFFKKIVHNVGRVLGVVPSSAERRYQRSLLDEQRWQEDERKKVEQDTKRKKEQLTALRRSIATGRKSLLSSWYEEDDGKESTIGS
jgi:hypothetical protein